MTERKDDYEVRKRDAELQAYGKLDLYRLIRIAQRLIQCHSIEEIRGMKEKEVQELCRPTECDAADVVAMCIVLDEYDKRARPRYLCS